MLKRMFLLGLASLSFLSSAVVGQTAPVAQWPSQPVRLVVPFPGGASTLDAVVRLLVPEVARDLAGSVFVENKPGAGTVIGVDAVAKAGDRHTFGGVANSFAVNQSLVKNLPYNLDKELIPVILLARTANVLAIRADLPVRNLSEFIAYAKKHPGKLSYGSFGNGTTPHFAGEMLKSMTGIDIVHVPYKAQGPALNDLLGGNIDLMFGNLPDFLAHIRSGKLRALGTTYLTRAPLAPEIPTIAEQGLPTFETDSWYGIIAPANTPKAVVDRINLSFNEALMQDSVRQNLRERGIEILGGTPADFGSHLQREVVKYADIVSTSKMKID